MEWEGTRRYLCSVCREEPYVYIRGSVTQLYSRGAQVHPAPARLTGTRCGVRGIVFRRGPLRPDGSGGSGSGRLRPAVVLLLLGGSGFWLNLFLTGNGTLISPNHATSSDPSFYPHYHHGRSQEYYAQDRHTESNVARRDGASRLIDPAVDAVADSSATQNGGDLSTRETRGGRPPPPIQVRCHQLFCLVLGPIYHASGILEHWGVGGVHALGTLKSAVGKGDACAELLSLVSSSSVAYICAHQQCPIITTSPMNHVLTTILRHSEPPQTETMTLVSTLQHSQQPPLPSLSPNC